MSGAPARGAGRRVLHVVTDLGAGGAERTLAALAPRLARAGWVPSVVALGGGGPFARALEADGVEVAALGMKSGRPSARGVAALVRLALRARPALVQGWMYHGNLAATLAAAVAGVPVVWNVRQSLGAPETERAATEVVIRLGARLSPRARAIVYNARASARQHEAIGYAAGGRAVVPNGFDTGRFRPDPAAREEVRRALGLPGDAPLAGCLARVHPVKDHRALLDAFVRVRRDRPDARLVLAGPGTDALPPDLAALAGATGTIGLGERADVPRLLAALDLAVLASRAEAFPNALGEAMACGVPCVATGVGEVGVLVGETGRVVPPGSPERLAAAWLEALAEGPERLRARGLEARARIERRYGLDAAAAAYDRLYSALLETPSA